MSFSSTNGKTVFMRLFAMILVVALVVSGIVVAFAGYDTAAVVETAKHGTGGYLNLRSKASTGSSRVAKIPNGKTIYVESMNGTWLKAKYGSKYGYVMAKFIKGTAAYNSANGNGSSSGGSSGSGSGSSGGTKPVYENYNVGHSIDDFFLCPECKAKGNNYHMTGVDHIISYKITGGNYSSHGMGFYKATARVSYRCPTCGFNNHNGIVDGPAMQGEVYSDRHAKDPGNVNNFTTAYPQYGNRD